MVKERGSQSDIYLLVKKLSFGFRGCHPPSKRWVCVPSPCPGWTPVTSSASRRRCCDARDSQGYIVEVVSASALLFGDARSWKPKHVWTGPCREMGSLPTAPAEPRACRSTACRPRS